MLILCVVALVGCGSKTAGSAGAGEQKADRIVVVKSSHTMTLFAKGRPIKVYKVALGRAAKSKDQMGDHKTPEGEYVVDGKNAQSRFHLALHVSQPNAADRKRARDEGVVPGYVIMVHGVEKQYAWLGPLQHDVDWTDGCIAVTDSEIEEVWRLVPMGTPIEIRP